MQSSAKPEQDDHQAPATADLSHPRDEYLSDDLEDDLDTNGMERKDANEMQTSVYDQNYSSNVSEEVINLPNPDMEEVSEITQDRRKWIPKCWFDFFSFDGNEEAHGYALDCIPRGAIQIGSSIFLSTALMHLAREAAGCPTEPPEGETKLPECNNRVYGFRPSSLLSIYAVVLGLCCSFFVPFIGALLDHIKYRRAAGRISVVLITLISFSQTFISESTWFAIAILTVVIAFADRVHMCVIYAYIPEITRDKDKLAKYTSSFHIIEHLSMLVFLIGMVVVTAATGISGDDVLCARVSQCAVFIVCAFGFGYAWTMLLGPRPASHDLPVGSSVWTIGFTHIYSTFKKILSKEGKLKWLLVAISFSSCARIALAAALITYVTDTLELTTTELGISILVMLGSTIVGCKASAVLIKKTNPLLTIKISLILWISLPCLIGATLSRPGQQLLLFCFAGALGFSGGLTYPAQQTLVVKVVPKGREAEMMGIYVFMTQILTWLPPIIFTVMNEAGINMRICIASFSLYFLIGLMMYLLLGKYNDVIVPTDTRDEQNELRDEGSNKDETSTLDARDSATENRSQLRAISNSV